MHFERQNVLAKWVVPHTVSTYTAKMVLPCQLIFRGKSEDGIET